MKNENSPSVLETKKMKQAELTELAKLLYRYQVIRPRDVHFKEMNLLVHAIRSELLELCTQGFSFFLSPRPPNEDYGQLSLLSCLPICVHWHCNVSRRDLGFFCLCGRTAVVNSSEEFTCFPNALIRRINIATNKAQNKAKKNEKQTESRAQNVRLIS